jgi:hypothetical protein
MAAHLCAQAAGLLVVVILLKDDFISLDAKPGKPMSLNLI